MNEASIVKGRAVFGIEPNCFAVIGKSSVVVAFSRISPAPIEKDRSVFRVESECFVEVGDSAIQVAAVASRHAFFFGLLRLALFFRFSHCPRFALLFCQPLPLSFLHLAVSFRHSRHALFLPLKLRLLHTLLYSMSKVSVAAQAD